MKHSSALPAFHLRGTGDLADIHFDLPPGSHSLGSSDQADYIVPAAGVSRHHACLHVTSEAVGIEDLGSTNGTFLDTQRIPRHQVVQAVPDADIRFGLACFRLEAIPDDDAKLALRFDPPSAASRDAVPEKPAAPPSPELSPAPDRSIPKPYDAEQTTRAVTGLQDQAHQDSWLDWLEGFSAALVDEPQGDLTRALSYLGAHLGATGCCVARWCDDQPPSVLAHWGEIAEIPTWRDLEGQGVALDAQAATIHPDGPSPFALSLYSEAVAPTGLLIQGELPDPTDLRPLRVLGRLLAMRGAQPSDIRHQTKAGLRFPLSYRPGTSLPMKALYSQMESLLHGDLPVLIHGETGSGKELVARILHDSSERRERPFVAVNCAAIPAELLEAEMFGIGKGVATGVEARPGKFRQAEGGTLFLDEIGEMVPALQAKLLRALQEKEIHPVGGEATRVDVRVISATNVDLATHMETGALRRDLYYRLAGFVLEVPALCDCAEDLPALIETFVRRFSTERGIHIRGVTVAALRSLLAYPWPGNVRELEQEIRRMVYLSLESGVLDSQKLSRHILRAREPETETLPALTFERQLEEVARRLDSVDAVSRLETFEAVLVREALRRTEGNKSAAARLLGISRNGLVKKLDRLSIDKPQQKEPLPDDASENG